MNEEKGGVISLNQFNWADYIRNPGPLFSGAGWPHN
jgi:hypothetical protein